MADASSNRGQSDSSASSSSVRRAVEASTMSKDITNAQLDAVRKVIECEVEKAQARRLPRVNSAEPVARVATYIESTRTIRRDAAVTPCS